LVGVTAACSFFETPDGIDPGGTAPSEGRDETSSPFAGSAQTLTQHPRRPLNCVLTNANPVARRALRLRGEVLSKRLVPG